MRQERAAEIQVPLDGILQTVFQMLRDDLAQHDLFREILGTYDDGLRTRTG